MDLTHKKTMLEPQIGCPKSSMFEPLKVLQIIYMLLISWVFNISLKGKMLVFYRKQID